MAKVKRKTKTKTKTKTKRKALVPATVELPSKYVTRDQLADLRDEIEGLLYRATEQATNAANRADADKKLIKDMQASLRNVQQVLQLDYDPHAPVMVGQVSWSYFHVWISRVVQRLDAIERVMGILK